ncbi:MAG TPA: ABC transporter permease [Microbacteriaceae bacterium]|nr:ABC transporter permease [Microbacteriaceae bacterium]
MLPKPRSRVPRWITGTLEVLALPIIILAAWSVSAIVSPNNRFPSLWAIGEAFGQTWFGSALTVDVLPSVGRLLTGIVIAVVAGIAVGLLVGSNRWLRSLVEPVFEFFRAIPPPMLVPLLALALGIGDQAKVLVIVAGAVWPVLLNTVEGVRAVDSVQRETARSYQLSTPRRVVSIVLPSAAPQIMAGVRQCISIALILMVISEMSASSSGIGYQILVFQTNYQYPQMWSGVILLGLIGILLALAFQLAERYVLGWYHGLKGAERA